MTFRNPDELGHTLVRLRLLEPAQFEQLVPQVASSDPNDLVALLESKHILTPYQASQLRRGNAEGLVLGDYKLLYRNASGSFARVFRAASLSDGQMVGLKVLRQRWAKDPDYVAQFRREAELCRRMKHKNVVPIYEVGSQDDFHYFTMEFVEGGNLRDFLRIRKKLSPVEAARCALDIAEGLGYALSMGATHRDMKLTNVLMSSDGVAKLVDFGLAGEDNPSGSSEGEQRALEYATLEQGTGAPANDPRSDLFFLGTILFELLAGTPPYPRTRSREERKQLSRYAHIRPLQHIDPTVPQVLLDIVDRLLEFDPTARYQRPDDLVVDLKRAVAELDEGAQTSEASGQAESPDEALPTVLCVEGRMKQQDALRDYLSKHGFRVFMISDVQRAQQRLKNSPPDVVVLMCESIGDDRDDAEVVEAVDEVSRLASSRGAVVVAVLGKKQANLANQLDQSPTVRVLAPPTILRDLRREIYRGVRHAKADDASG